MKTQIHAMMMTLSQIVTTGVIALTMATGAYSANAAGATQVSGVGFLDFGDECDESLGAGADLAIHMEEGDLTGCLYVFVEGFVCSPSGTYRDWGTELFVGWYHGEYGTFATTYVFEAKLEDCDPNREIFGRCQHPIVAGQGTGVFEGVTGRIDFKDDVETGELFYRGHLRW